MRHLIGRVARGEIKLRRDANDAYVSGFPRQQALFELFEKDWISRLPLDDGPRGGDTELFADYRMTWAAERIDFENADVVELGPLEGGHTYMALNAGAKTVTAVEGHQRSYLRCLVVKEMFGLTNAQFLLGDFVDYLRADEADRHDLCVANGVLYHMDNPVELIELICKRTDRVVMWTHYFDEAGKGPSKNMRQQMKRAPVASIHGGFSHTLHRRDYGVALSFRNFCGGPRPWANWLPREDILGAFAHFGFEIGDILEDGLTANGPAFTVVASRKN
ncbi:MAG TPA: class I SAM-dependent methyltransferase [Baekduia sp.]|nr:class I SAM-dependent methyltransferase [Baekduia sp.]